MTNEEKIKGMRWIIGIATTIALALLSIQVTVMIQMSQNFIEFSKANAEQHNDIEIEINGIKLIYKDMYNYTHSIYDYEITPNTLFRKKYESKLEKTYFSNKNNLNNN